MQIDLLTVAVGFGSFGIFFLIHIITFRRLHPEALLKSLAACGVAIAVLPVMLMVILFFMKAVDAPVLSWVLAGVLATLISGGLSLVYVLTIFGPYETSVRMRLVREIAKGGPDGISHQELLDRYNARTIMDIRLRRLKGSGDVIEEGGLYRAGRTRNVFLLFDVVAGVIKKWIG